MPPGHHAHSHREPVDASFQNAAARFFASHPMTEERIRIVESEAAGLARKASLTHDTRNYQSFRSQFR